MSALKIEDIRSFTAGLFIGNLFDVFWLREAEVVTFAQFHIDGRLRKEYYTEAEQEEQPLGDWTEWAQVKPFCFSLIKGKRLPGSFRLVLQLPRRELERFLARAQLGLRPEQVQGLYLNIRYEEGMLRCVTGTALNFFTMDKSLETEWDGYVRRFFREHGIPCMEE